MLCSYSTNEYHYFYTPFAFDDKNVYFIADDKKILSLFVVLHFAIDEI